MNIHEILSNVRAQNHLSQEAFAEKLFVTRQAVSRWENGESIPNIDTLKRISEKFGISLDELLHVERSKDCQLRTTADGTWQTNDFTDVNFADVYEIMANAGLAHMGIGRAKGKNKGELAAKEALSSLPPQVNLRKAKGIVIYVTASPDIGLDEINHSVSIISCEAHPNATIGFGAALDPTLEDEIKIALVVTDF